MAKVKLYNMNHDEVGSMTVSDEVFKADVNEALIHEVVVAQLANKRQGTKSTLTRSEVRGHAKKPHRQKHTGNARQGSTKGPHQTGGGVAFAPKPRDYSKKVNKQAKKAALLSALSDKFASNKIIFLDEFKFEEAKAKLAAKFMKDFALDRKALVVVDENNEVVTRACANLEDLSLQLANVVSVYEIVKYPTILMTKSAVKLIEEGLKE